MENQPYLIFNLNGSLYGVEVLCVQEILPLPELTPVVAAPPDIVGVVNLRGDILPVMDLNLRLGYQPQEYSLTDSVIVSESRGFRVGIIVNQVHEVQNLSPQDIITELSYGREVVTHSHHFIAGVAKVAADVVMLLNFENLIHYCESVEALIGKSRKEGLELEKYRAIESESLYAQKAVFCPQATLEERSIFQQRAENLMRATDQQDSSGLIPLAVVALNHEYFGLEMDIVREFTDIRKVTPIPCCPQHIVGNMNLRGEILTLVDIRSALKMSMNTLEMASKAIVVCINNLVVGVTVDEVFDVMYLNPSQIAPTPTSVEAMNDGYLRGTAPYRGKIMSLLDLSKLLTQGDLIVNEEV